MTTIRELRKYARNACERSTPESAEKSASGPQVPWVPKCLKCMTAMSALSGLSARVSWVLEYSSAYTMLTKCLLSSKIGQNFGSIFVRMNKSVKNAELIERFLSKICWIKIVYTWSNLNKIILEAIENSVDSE